MDQYRALILNPKSISPSGSRDLKLWFQTFGQDVTQRSGIVFLIGFLQFSVFFSSFFLFFSVPFIGFPITSQNVNKKSQEFPLGGHSRCSKTGLAPCRQCSFSSFCFFLMCFFWPNLQIQTPKSKIQNQTSKITHQKNETVLRKHYHFSFCFIIVFFAVHWISHHVPKRQQNSREFPLRGPSPCGKTGLAPCRQCTYSSFLLFFFLICFFCFFNLFFGVVDKLNPEVAICKV